MAAADDHARRDAIAPGRVVAEKYRIERLIGEGGMSVVVEATHLALGTKVALKLIGDKRIPSSEKRLLREARAVARLKSDHTVRVLDMGTFDDGSPFIVMERLLGQSLGAYLRTRGSLSPAEAATYALHVCESLAEAHAAGIIHRDLKPSNLFLIPGPDGGLEVKVLDFGIAKDFGAMPSGSTPTTGFEVLGSPGYSSPEQVRGAHVDGRADIWALGVTIYELLSLERPFVAATKVDVLAKTLGEAPRPLPDEVRASLPTGLEAIILRCLEKEPERRFADVAELADALAPYAPEHVRDYAVLVRERLGSAPGTTTPASSAPSAPPRGTSADASTGIDGAYRANDEVSSAIAPVSTSQEIPAGVPQRKLWPIGVGLAAVAVVATAGAVVLRRAPAPTNASAAVTASAELVASARPLPSASTQPTASASPPLADSALPTTRTPARPVRGRPKGPPATNDPLDYR